LHLSHLLALYPFELVGIFDSKFGTPLYDSKEFSVMGFVDVIPKIKKAKEAIQTLALASKECDKVLLIDAPSFNIPLAKAIKKINPQIEIIYYILPKVWAWKRGRIKVINQLIDKKAFIFPFERKYWIKEYVGNPLLDEITQFRDDLVYNQVAFLPGSRKSEIKALMPIFRQLATKIQAKKVLVVPRIYADEMDIYGDIGEFEVSFDTQKTLLTSDFAYICSGTATLEAAIIGTPFVLMYKARKIEYLIAKLFVKLDYVGLANIIFQQANKGEFHKEYLQDFDIEALLSEYQNSSIDEFIAKSQILRDVLGHGSALEVVKLIKGD